MSEPGTQLEISRIEPGLRLVGEVDAHTAQRLEDALMPLVAGGERLELQVDGVGFMDSSGLRIVIAATEQLRAGGGDLVLVGPTPLVRRLLDVSGVGDHLSITPTDG